MATTPSPSSSSSTTSGTASWLLASSGGPWSVWHGQDQRLGEFSTAEDLVKLLADPFGGA